MAHLHRRACGDAGPVVAHLLPDEFDARNRRQVRRLPRVLSGFVTVINLLVSLAGEPIGSLADAIRSDNIYVSIHAEQNPSGDIRGHVDREVLIDRVKEV